MSPSKSRVGTDPPSGGQPNEGESEPATQGQSEIPEASQSDEKFFTAEWRTRLETSSLYEYEPFTGPDKIRVFELNKNVKTHIELTIREISSFDGGYQAISYVWGDDQEHVNRAFVCGKDGYLISHIPLTATLSSLLCDLRDAKILEKNCFWIDQICIDQAGKEKGHQVNLMGKIYATASRVVTYLGRPGIFEDVKIMMKLLSDINHHFEPNYHIFDKFPNLALVRDNESEFPVQKMSANIQDQFTNSQLSHQLVELAFGNWTKRLWIIQEQLLNDNIVMLFGHQLFQWDFVTILPSLFFLDLLPAKNAQEYWNCYEPGGSQWKYWAYTNSVFFLWRQRREMDRHVDSRKLNYRLSGSGSWLLRNMHYFETLHCRDPRDRIYALLAISADSGSLGVIPDYSDANEVDQCFRDVSIRMLQSRSDLDLLNMACRWHALKTRPRGQSWALSDPSTMSDFPAMFVLENLAPHPTKTLASPVRFSACQSVLIVRGRILERISLITPQVTEIIDYWLNYLPFLTSLCTPLLQLGVTLGNLTSLGRVIVAQSAWPTATAGVSASESLCFTIWCFFHVIISRSRQCDLTLHQLQLVEYCTRLYNILTDLVESTQFYEDMCADNVSSQDDKTVLSAEEYEVMYSDVEAIGWFKSRVEFSEPPCYEYYSIDQDKMRNTIIRTMVSLESQLVGSGRTICITDQNSICNGLGHVKEGDYVAAFQGSQSLWIIRAAGDKYTLVGDAYVDGLMQGESYAGQNPDDVDYDISLI